MYLTLIILSVVLKQSPVKYLVQRWDMNTETVVKSRGYVVKIAFHFSLISALTGYQVHAATLDLTGHTQAFSDQHVCDV